MNDDLELLAARHLDGSASAEDRARLDRILRDDPAARAELLRQARLAADLQEIFRRETGAAALRSPSRWTRLLPSAAAAVFLLAVGAIIFRPDPPPSAAPAESPERRLFNGRDLSGWRIRNGSWTVVDGVLRNEMRPGGGMSRLESEASFRNFELRASVRATGLTSFEVQYRDYSGFVTLNWKDLRDWADLRLVARGETVQATLNGAPVEIDHDPKHPGRKAEGAVGFYAPAVGSLQIRDVRIRELP